MANFPTKGDGLTQGESPSLYSNIAEENVLKGDSDGGYEFRRRRFTRAPRRKIKTGFINLPQLDFLALDLFFDEHQHDKPFLWFDYLRNRYYQVRFDKFEPDYKGVGQHQRWDIKIEMSEV